MVQPLNQLRDRRALRPALGAGAVAAALALLLGAPADGPWSLRSAQAGVVAAPATGAAGATWSGSVIIQNNGSEPASAIVNFYSTAGVLVKSHPLPSPIPPKGSVTVDTDSITDLPVGFAGSAVVSAAQPVSATYVSLDSANPAMGRGVYSGSVTGSNRVFIPVISNNYSDQTSVVGVQNVDGGPVTVSLKFYDRFTGALSATVSDALAPGAAHYYDASALPGPQQLPPPWTGSAVIEASGNVAAAVQQPYLSSNKVVGFEGASSASSELYLPTATFQLGAEQQTSFISVQNTTGNAITVTVNFHDRAGNLVGQAGGVIDAYRKTSWNPGSAGVPVGYTGSAVVRASGPVAATVNVGSTTDVATAYTAATSGTLRAALPYIRWAPDNDPKGWRTSISVMNVDQTTAADITVRYYDANGTLVWSQALTGVAPNTNGNHHPGAVVGNAPFAGSVEVESTRPVVAVVTATTVDGTLAESYTGNPIP